MKEQTYHHRGHEAPSSHEHHLASVMLRRELGHTATFDGASHVTVDDFHQLVDTFRDDPKESLAYAREMLFALAGNQDVDKESKESMVDEYLDAYFDVTIRLDRAAFPETDRIQQGVPEYIPDGYIDMGSNHVVDPSQRNREQIWVDKRAIFAENKAALKHLVLEMPRDYDATMRKQAIVNFLSQLVHAKLRPGKDYVDNPTGDKAKLSEIQEGICRHQAMLFQVLTQAMGVQSRLVKCSLNGTRHVANTVRVDGQWYLMDVANPDYSRLPDGKTEWNMGLVKIDAPPQPKEIKQYDVTFKKSGEKRLYTTHDRSYWRIEHP